MTDRLQQISRIMDEIDHVSRQAQATKWVTKAGRSGKGLDWLEELRSVVQLARFRPGAFAPWCQVFR